jgi:sortase A
MRVWARPAAALLALAAAAVLAWVAITLVWGDPVTARAASRAQGTLRKELAGNRAASAAVLEARLDEGDAIGTIVVARLHLRMVVVEGTARADLARGPGHYRNTSLPGLGGTVAIAGHRTTYLQPFRHLDRLEAGDEIKLVMPYGTFRYHVYARRIVSSDDWSILRRRSFEKLVLSACHPLYSASQRIVVFARLIN